MVEFPLRPKRPHDTQDDRPRPCQYFRRAGRDRGRRGVSSAPRRLQYVDAPTPASGQSVTIGPGGALGRIPLPLDFESHQRVAGGNRRRLRRGRYRHGGVDWQGCVGGRRARVFLVSGRAPYSLLISIQITSWLAQWLQERSGVPVIMSQRTHELARSMWGGEGRYTLRKAEQVLLSHGVSDAQQSGRCFAPTVRAHDQRHAEGRALHRG